MVKTVVHDPIFLSGKSEPATKADLQVATDLLDTLRFHRKGCVGMAANMIGVRRRIIAFDNEGKYEVMFNPEIVMQAGEFETKEGCLSLSGVRSTKRYKMIRVRFQNSEMQTMEKPYMGFTAQIIQHEIDHCNGVLI